MPLPSRLQGWHLRAHRQARKSLPRRLSTDPRQADLS